MISSMAMVHTPIDAATDAGGGGGRRPTVVAAPVAASPDRPRRRTFTAQDKPRKSFSRRPRSGPPPIVGWRGRAGSPDLRNRPSGLAGTTALRSTMGHRETSP
jgi:hypothetical protein